MNSLLFLKRMALSRRDPIKIFFISCVLLSLIIAGGNLQAQQSPATSQEVLVPGCVIDRPSLLPNWIDGNYHDYSKMVEALSTFTIQYPGLVDQFSLGKSVDGREIWCLRVTNEQENKGKYACLIDGCIHGNEWEGGEACLYLAEYLLINFGRNATVTHVLNTTEVYFVPLVNPDGRENDDRFNENGIDLNRNFDVNFGRFLGRSIPLGKIFGIKLFTWCGWPGTKYVWTNSGRSPFSEPESQAIGRFMETIKNKEFSFYVTCHTAVHCFGAPSYVVRRSDYTLNSTEINVFEYAKSWVENHTEYQAAKNNDPYGMGDSMSWCFKEFQIPSFVFEILSKEYDPWFGHGKHDHLVHWMKTALPVFLYLLVNIENLHQWKEPTIEPPLPDGVPPPPLP